MYRANEFFDLSEKKYCEAKTFEKIENETDNETRYRQFFTNNTLWEITHFWNKNVKNFPAHIHDYWELLFVLRGDLDFFIEDSVYHIEPLDIVVIPKGCFHRPVIRNTSLAYERYCLWISYDLMEKLSTDEIQLSEYMAAEMGESSFLIPGGLAESAPIQNAIRYLAELSASPSMPGRDILINGFMQQIALYTGHVMRMPELSKHIASRKVKSTAVTAALNYIADHLTEPITLESMAQELFMSKYYLSHTFKAHMGISLHQYVIGKRLALAKKLIVDGYPLNQVYLACGFSNYSNFFKTFKADTSVAPSEYANQHMASGVKNGG